MPALHLLDRCLVCRMHLRRVAGQAYSFPGSEPHTTGDDVHKHLGTVTFLKEFNTYIRALN